MMQASAVRLSLEASRPAVVLDLSLLLAREGLLLALLLATCTRCFLPKALFAVLDDHCLGESLESDPVDSVVAAWNDARVGLDLAATEGLFWPHDSEDEAVLPKGHEGAFIARVDAFAAGLEWRWRQQVVKSRGNDHFDTRQHLRETLALVAALWRERPVLLTALPAPDVAPAVVVELAAVGIPVPRAEHDRVTPVHLAGLRTLLADSGVAAHALAAGLTLAAVHLCVPQAPLAIRHVGGEPEDFWDADLEAPTADGETMLASLWDGASAFWYELP